MNHEQAYNFIDREIRDKNNLPDNEIIDYGGLDETINDIEFFSESIRKVETEHEPKENWGMPCFRCGGTGGVTYTENQSPLGSGQYWPMEMSEPCPECSEKGICPKCGYNMDFNEETAIQTCSRCGYDDSMGDQ